MKKIKSIEIELTACRKAWAANPTAKLAWCCHHAVELEILTEPAKNRINYILSCKSKEEQAIRLHNFRPVRVNLPEAVEKACAEWNKARAELNKAFAEWNKACAEWNKACAELNKARAEWNKACAEWNKARAEWNKACAEWNKAFAEWNKACAEWNKAIGFHKSELSALHSQDWPDNTWNGENIFDNK